MEEKEKKKKEKRKRTPVSANDRPITGRADMAIITKPSNRQN